MTSPFEAYVQAYPDLALWYSTAQERSRLEGHFIDRAHEEGRLLPGVLEIPPDWSDQLYSRFASNEAVSLWKLGVIKTLFYRAQIEHPENFQQLGQMGRSELLCKLTSLAPEALMQAASFERSATSGGIIEASLRDSISWQGLAPVVASQLSALRPTAGNEVHDVAILVPSLETGGAELVAYWHYHAAIIIGLKPIIIITDKKTVTNFFAHKNLKVVNIPALVESELGLDYNFIAIEQKLVILSYVLNSVNATVIHLVHSFVGYKLASSTVFRDLAPLRGRLVVSMFCPHLHRSGVVDGYFRFIPLIDELVAYYLSDNEWYGTHVMQLYGIPRSRFHRLRYPAANGVATHKYHEQASTVLWASRLDYQKNARLAFEIASLLPQYEFNFFGRRVMEDDDLDWQQAPPNVKYCGEFFGFEEIELGCYALFLYTSRFDGLPNVLLEAAAAGLPIVSSSVGGIREFLDDTMAIVIEAVHDASSYATAILDLLNDSKRRLAMSQSCLSHIKSERSVEQFCGAIRELPLYIDFI